MTISGDPLAFLKIVPGVDPATIANIEESKHLNDPIVVQYVYWVQDAFTNQFDTTIIGELKIMPDIQRVMGHTLQLVIMAEVLAILVAIAIGVYRPQASTARSTTRRRPSASSVWRRPCSGSP